MSNLPQKIEYFVLPGSICLPAKETMLYAVAGSGIILTLYDHQKKIGGMSYFFQPRRVNKKDARPIYALPAIVGLIKMLVAKGCKKENLEAQVYGGAENIISVGYKKDLAKLNIEAVFQILERNQITVTSFDVGSKRGRKVAFNSTTGETIVAKVNKIRDNDWFPQVE